SQACRKTASRLESDIYRQTPSRASDNPRPAPTGKHPLHAFRYSTSRPSHIRGTSASYMDARCPDKPAAAQDLATNPNRALRAQPLLFPCQSIFSCCCTTPSPYTASRFLHHEFSQSLQSCAEKTAAASPSAPAFRISPAPPPASRLPPDCG